MKKAVQKKSAAKPAAKSTPIQSSTPKRNPVASKKAAAPAVVAAAVAAPSRLVLKAVVPVRPVHPEPRERVARAPAPAQNILDSQPHESIDPGMLGNDDVHDETDYAQWMQLVEQAEIAKRAREMSRTVVDPNFDGVHCVDCDCDIPAKRLEHGFDRCVDCKQAIEDEQARQKRLAG